MTAKPPPDPFDPIFETLTAGTTFFRVHPPVFSTGAENDGTVPNPGKGRPTRFAFFGDPIVPVLYAADTPEGAVHESILHDKEPGMFLPRTEWQDRVLTALELTVDVEVVVLHSHGLRRLDAFAREVTDTDASDYGTTVQWAEAAWAAGAAGVSFMCRHYNSSQAVCLFADRLPAGALMALPDHPQTRAFVVPTDAEWLAQLAFDMKVVLRP